MLLQIRTQVTPVWYEFGQAVGVSQEILDKCLGHPADECVVEVLDHWLRMHNPTWKDVSKGLSEVGLKNLSDGILDVYKTGKKFHSMSEYMPACLNYHGFNRKTSHRSGHEQFFTPRHLVTKFTAQ